MDDDDVPPPLSSLQDQVAALHLQANPRAPTGDGQEQDVNLPVAATTFVGMKPKEEAKKAKPELKRGFFDAKRTKPKTKAEPQPKTLPDGITVLTGKKDGLGRGGQTIPDFLRVEPDEQTKRLDEIKGKLVNALKPTPETVAKLGSNPDLMAGFNDPEVMAAVEEIKIDPSKGFSKYKNNQKVQAFYRAMAMFAGNQLETINNKPI